MSNRVRLWVSAAIVGAAVSFGPVLPAQAQPVQAQQVPSQDGGYELPRQLPEVDQAGQDDHGLWGLIGLAGLLGLLGLVRRGPRRDRKNALAGYPAATPPRIPDANGAHTPPGGQPIPPQVRGAELPGETAVPGSGKIASERPLRRWP